MVMLMFLGRMFMFMRVDSIRGIVGMSGVIVSVAVFVEENRMRVRMRMIFVDEQQRAADHQDGGDDK